MAEENPQELMAKLASLMGEASSMQNKKSGTLPGADLKSELGVERENLKNEQKAFFKSIAAHVQYKDKERQDTKINDAPSGTALVKSEGSLPAVVEDSKDTGGLDFSEILPSVTWGDLFEFPHRAAIDSAAVSGNAPMLSAPFIFHGGSEMVKKLKSRTSRHEVFAAILARQIVDAEIISGICSGIINSVSPEKLPESLVNADSVLQSAIKMKLTVDTAQRAAIIADSKLGAVNSSLCVKNSTGGQINIAGTGGLQQVQNGPVAKIRSDDLTKPNSGPLRKHVIIGGKAYVD